MTGVASTSWPVIWCSGRRSAPPLTPPKGGRTGFPPLGGLRGAGVNLCREKQVVRLGPAPSLRPGLDLLKSLTINN